MLVRIVMGLVMIGFGSVSLYLVTAKPQHDWSKDPFAQAIGIPQIVTRVLRGVVGLLFIGLGIVAILRVTGLIP